MLILLRVGEGQHKIRTSKLIYNKTDLENVRHDSSGLGHGTVVVP